MLLGPDSTTTMSVSLRLCAAASPPASSPRTSSALNSLIVGITSSFHLEGA